MNLAYDVFVNDPPPQDGFLPNGEPKRFSPMASTLIYGNRDAVLTDPGVTEDQASVLGDWVASKGRNLTDIFITHGHGDHWFAAGLLAERFRARVVASAGTIAQMHAGAATRPLLWDKLYQRIPPSPVTAVPVPGNRFTLEGRDLVIVEVGALQPGTSSQATRTSGSTTTPRGRSRRPGATWTTPRNYCGPRRPRPASSTPRSPGTRTRQCGFHHLAQISRHTAPYAWARLQVSWACYCPGHLSDHGSAIRFKDTSSSPCPLRGLYSSTPRGSRRLFIPAVGPWLAIGRL